MRINSFVPSEKIFETFNNGINNSGNNVEKNSGTFGSILKEKLDHVNDLQLKAEDMTQKFIQGDDVELHDMMITTEESKLSLQMAVQVRNKLVEAYQELSRMQL